MPDAALYATSDNPVPEGARVGFLLDRARRRVRYAVFPNASRPARGTVMVLTGRNEAIEKYFETARDLNRRGLVAVALDWRGQGGSDRILKNPQRGHVASFSDYVEDFDLVFEDVALPDTPAPYYVLAHSTGALVALLAAPRHANQIRRMVLLSPLLEISGFSFAHKGIHRLSHVMAGIGLGRLYLGGGPRKPGAPAFEGNRLTSDPVRFARNAELLQAHPQLALGGPTASWVRAACRAVAASHEPAFISSVRIPTLFVAAGADRVVSTAAIERYAPRLRAGALVTVDGARHEIPQEADRYREQMWAAFDAFVPGSDSGV
ncbi:MAG: alpha/beta hydrolase [Methylobacterium mesophilicum]|nr:alpha/beta hydrolase [Methylobacterium mesophilicum]